VIADLFEVHIKQLVADKSEVYRNGNWGGCWRALIPNGNPQRDRRSISDQ
jgi:hypothetical protein